MYTPEWELVLNIQSETNNTQVPVPKYGSTPTAPASDAPNDVIVVQDIPPCRRHWRALAAAAAAAACVYVALKD